MEAIILVGGQGVRLRPLTAQRHKSLVPVANQPAIEHLIEWLARHGIERVILAMGAENADLAAAYPRGGAFGVELSHVVEHVRLESGGAIRNAVAESGISDRFLVLNGDIYVDFDLSRMLATHRAAGAALTLGLTPVADTSSFGIAVVDGVGLVTGFVEKPLVGTAPGNLANAGIWIFERHVVDEIALGAIRVEDTLFPQFAERRRRIVGYEFEGRWADIGTAARYLELNVSLARADGGAIVAPSASLYRARVADSVIGNDATIRSGASVHKSVLWERVRVGEGARVWGSILANDVEVGAGASATGVVAGAGSAIEAGAIVGQGTVLEPGERYHRRHGT